MTTGNEDRVCDMQIFFWIRSEVTKTVSVATVVELEVLPPISVQLQVELEISNTRQNYIKHQFKMNI